MSRRKLKKGKTKIKRVSKLNGLDIDLDCLIAMTKEYLTDLTTEQESHSLIGKTTTFRRFRKLDEEIIMLTNGENPPPHSICPDYKPSPSNPRKCIECGERHDTIIENTITGERLSELDKCKECLFKSGFKLAEGKFDFPTTNISTEWKGTARCITSDDRNVNMAEEIRRLEKEMIDGMEWNIQY